MPVPSGNVTAMSFFAHIIADLLELPDIPLKALRQAKKVFFLVMMFAFPATFVYGIQLFIEHESAVMQHELKGVFDRAMAIPASHSLVHP